MNDNPTSASEQKPASPTNPNPQQQQQQGDNKPGTDKPASQPQQK
jgi:hypothetical protein